MEVIPNRITQFSMVITLQVHPRLAQQDPGGEAPQEHHGGGGQRLQRYRNCVFVLYLIYAPIRDVS
jgi:hypothetical protein